MPYAVRATGTGNYLTITPGFNVPYPAGRWSPYAAEAYPFDTEDAARAWIADWKSLPCRADCHVEQMGSGGTG